MEDDEESDSKKSLLFGTDFSAIPCFRETFLTSISSGFVTGFAYFMFTSKTGRAVHVGYGTFFGVTFGYWIYCRYNYSYQKHLQRQTQKAITNALSKGGPISLSEPPSEA